MEITSMFIMTKGLHIISFNSNWFHWMWVENLILCLLDEESWWSVVISQNIRLKCQISLALLLLQLKDNGILNAFWNWKALPEQKVTCCGRDLHDIEEGRKDIIESSIFWPILIQSGPYSITLINKFYIILICDMA